jgi:hypothetical protein
MRPFPTLFLNFRIEFWGRHDYDDRRKLGSRDVFPCRKEKSITMMKQSDETYLQSASTVPNCYSAQMMASNVYDPKELDTTLKINEGIDENVHQKHGPSSLYDENAMIESHIRRDLEQRIHMNEEGTISLSEDEEYGPLNTELLLKELLQKPKKKLTSIDLLNSSNRQLMREQRKNIPSKLDDITDHDGDFCETSDKSFDNIEEDKSHMSTEMESDVVSSLSEDLNHDDENLSDSETEEKNGEKILDDVHDMKEIDGSFNLSIGDTVSILMTRVDDDEFFDEL